MASSYRVTVVHYTYAFATLSAAYLCRLYLDNHFVTLHLCVSNLISSLCSLAVPTESLLHYSYGCATLTAAYFCEALPTESLIYTLLIGVQPQVQPKFVISSYRITNLN